MGNGRDWVFNYRRCGDDAPMEKFLRDPIGLLLNGLLALALSVLMWKLTGNWWGRFVLFMPGGALVILGWIALLRKY
jgi:hypothetical protein